jgi:hypothetical protein
MGGSILSYDTHSLKEPLNRYSSTNHHLSSDCCGCAKNCESGYTLFDLCLECHGGERGNLCRQDKHKLRRRFVGHEMTSFEEFSPNIANFGVKKSLEEDAKLDADTEVNVDKKVDIKEKSDIDPNINTNDNVDTEENVDIEENVDTLEGADTDERLDASEKVQSKEKVGVDEKAEVDETADANMKVDTHERVNIDVKGDGD